MLLASTTFEECKCIQDQLARSEYCLVKTLGCRLTACMLSYLHTCYSRYQIVAIFIHNRLIADNFNVRETGSG